MLLEKIIIAISIIISYFMQSSIEFFSIGNIKPDFLLLLTIYFALFRGEFTGIWVGFFGGLLQDINLGIVPNFNIEKIRYFLGINILPKALIGYATGKISKGITKDNYFTWIAISFIFSLIKGVLVFLLTAFSCMSVASHSLVSVILPESIYNALLSVVWFKFLLWAIPPIKTGNQ